MNQEELKQLLLKFDPNLKKHFWAGSGEDYTVWSPHNRSTRMADDLPDDVTVTVTIHRFTKNDQDHLIYQIQEALDKTSVTSDDVIVDFEESTNYFHYILDCYVTV